MFSRRGKKPGAASDGLKKNKNQESIAQSEMMGANPPKRGAGPRAPRTDPRFVPPRSAPDFNANEGMLDDSRRLLSLAAEMGQLGHIRFNLVTGEADVSPELYRLLGYGPDDTLPPGEDLAGLFYFGDQNFLQSAVAEAIEAKEPYKGEMPFRRIDGQLRHARVYAEPEMNADGEVVGIFAIAQDVTDQKEKEIALAAINAELIKEQRVQKLASDLAGLGSWRYDLETEEFAWSERLAGFFGLKLSDGVGSIDIWEQMFMGGQSGAWASSLQAALKSVEAVGEHSFEYTIKRRDGVVRHLSASMVGELNHEGKVKALFGVVRDITERKEHELELEEVNLRLREQQDLWGMAAEFSSLGYWRSERPSGKRLWSDQLFRMHGLKRLSDAPSHEQLDGVIDAEDAERLQSLVAEGFAEGRDYETEYGITLPDGQRRILQVKTAAQSDEGGGVKSVFGVIQDITESKRQKVALQDANTELQGQRDLWEMASNQAKLGYWQVALPNGTPVWSDQLLKLYGYEPGSPPSFKEFHSQIKPEESQRLRKIMAEGIANKTGYETEYAVRLPNGGGERVVYTRTQYDIDDDTSEETLFGIVQDITERKQQENALLEARDEAEAAGQAKSDFLAMMSHEIRTPLNGVLGMASLLETSAMTPQQKQQLGIIQQSGNALMTIINDVLDYSKLMAGRVDIVKGPFDVRQSVQTIIDTMTSAVSEKEIALQIDIADRVPDQVLADDVRVRQVLFNFVGNAVKFTQRGSVTVRVGLEGVEAEERKLRFEICDTGIGIPEEVQSQLFTPFTQADASIDREFGGTGLGLTICHQLVELMEGEVGLESKEGEGSTFWFTLPLEFVDAAEAPSGDRAEGTIGIAHQGLHLLVAEDNEINVKVIGTMLDHFGCTYESVGNGREAVDAVKTKDFDAVLMDVQMPVLSGIDAAQEIRALGDEKANVRIVALTANAMAGDRERYIDAGMSDYLSKPITIARIQELLDRLRKK